LRTLDGDTPARRGWFSSTHHSSDSVTQRDQAGLPDGIRLNHQQAQRRRNLESLLRETATDQSAVWQQAMYLAGELSVEHRAELFMQCAAHRFRTGQSAMAFELLRQVHRLPEPLALRESARLRLFWYLASEEAMLQWPISPTLAAQQVSQAGRIQDEPEENETIALAAPLEFDGEPPAAVAASVTVDQQQAAQLRVQQAERLIATIQAEQPDLYFEPLLRFPLAAFQRRTGQVDAARQYWRSQLSGRSDPAYRSWAASELALLEAERLPSRPCWNCPRLTEAPRLDGRLDDPAWQSVSPTQLEPVPPGLDAPSSSSTQVRWAYDAQFLYLAVQADKIATLTYPGPGAVRRRDDVLEGDRVDVYLDVDRDGVTYWHLSIDHRGRARESLNDDISWNPQWYIAATEDESTWSIEAAIALESLCQQTSMTGQSWCLGIQRIMPGHGWETWLQPAPVEARPEEFGLLRFQ
jgi:hypothetical protein